MKWTDEQLLIFLKCSSAADGGCSFCVSDMIKEFITLTTHDFLPVMEKLWNDHLNELQFVCRAEWKEVMPLWTKWEENAPKDQRYIIE